MGRPQLHNQGNFFNYICLNKSRDRNLRKITHSCDALLTHLFCEDLLKLKFIVRSRKLKLSSGNYLFFKSVIVKTILSNPNLQSPRRGGDIALIVGPVVGGILFIAVIAVLVFLIMARKKRKSEGKYKPATQELTSPRLQLDNIIKPPPEERLI